MPNLPTLEDAERALRLHVLSTMDASSSADLSDWTAFHLSVFVAPGCSKEMARAVCRDLRVLGHVQYHRALWSEDGEAAGSGYALTPDGRNFLKQELERANDQS